MFLGTMNISDFADNAVLLALARFQDDADARMGTSCKLGHRG